MDAATFDFGSLESIWGRAPMCCRCEKMMAEDFHHICKRRMPRHADDLSATTSFSSRTIMSSVYNSAPLCRECHEKGDKHRPTIMSRLLNRVNDKVEQAIKDGRYTEHAADGRFQELFAPLYHFSSNPRP